MTSMDTRFNFCRRVGLLRPTVTCTCNPRSRSIRTPSGPLLLARSLRTIERGHRVLTGERRTAIKIERCPSTHRLAYFFAMVNGAPASAVDGPRRSDTTAPVSLANYRDLRSGKTNVHMWERLCVASLHMRWRTMGFQADPGLNGRLHSTVWTA